MKVGIPTEIKNNEFRVAITPAGVYEFRRAGHEVFVQSGAGTGSSLPDGDYEAAGAKVLGGEALERSSTATTIRNDWDGGSPATVTDGPFVETKEVLGGYYLIEAKDLNEAIQVAARIPSARFGAIEVRPVVDFSQGAGSEQAGATEAVAR